MHSQTSFAHLLDDTVTPGVLAGDRQPMRGDLRSGSRQWWGSSGLTFHVTVDGANSRLGPDGGRQLWIIPSFSSVFTSLLCKISRLGFYGFFSRAVTFIPLSHIQEQQKRSNTPCIRLDSSSSAPPLIRSTPTRLFSCFPTLRLGCPAC